MKRNSTIDTARGISILLVVLGHNWIMEHDLQGELPRALSSFRMPLFFFLAGLFLKTSTQWKSFLLARANTLLKPYFVVLCAFFFIWILRPIKAGTLNLSHLDYFLGVAYGTGLTIAWVPMWFLTHLFATSAVALLILKSVEKMPSPRLVAWTLSIISLIFGFSHLQEFWQPEPYNWNSLGIHGLPGLPWSLDLIFITAPFLIFGHLLREEVKSIKWNPLHTFLAFFLFLTLHYFFDETLDLNHRNAGDFSIEIPQALLGIYITINISALIQKSKICTSILGYCGSGSLFILIFHDYIQRNMTTLAGSTLFNMQISSFMALPSSIAASLLIFEITKRNKMLAKLLLPSKT